MSANQTPSLFRGPVLSPDWPFGDVEPWTFDFIMADPPWRFDVWSEKGLGKSAEAHYETMPLSAICALPVAQLASQNCLLWLWARAPMLPDALECMRAWRFTFVTMGAWHKRTAKDKSQFGGGYVLRSACEPFLIGKIGDPSTTKSTRNIVVGKVREHSRKPDEAFAAAEALMPGARRIELFSRQTRPNWTNWGNEARKFNEAHSNEHDAPADSDIPACADTQSDSTRIV